MSWKFSQIQPWTAELAALDKLILTYLKTTGIQDILMNCWLSGERSFLFGLLVLNLCIDSLWSQYNIILKEMFPELISLTRPQNGCAPADMCTVAGSILVSVNLSLVRDIISRPLICSYSVRDTVKCMLIVNAESTATVYNYNNDDFMFKTVTL